MARASDEGMDDSTAVQRYGGRCFRAGGIKNGGSFAAFPSYQFHCHIPDDLQAGRADLVDRVILGVPGRIVEVDHVDRANPNLLQLEVIVDQRMPG